MGGDKIPGLNYGERWELEFRLLLKALKKNKHRLAVCGIFILGLFWWSGLSPFQQRMFRWELKWLLREYADQYETLLSGNGLWVWYRGYWG